MIENNFFRLDLDSAVNKIVQEIDKLVINKNILVALDGRSGTGKSTIAQKLAQKVNGVIVVGDDFYSGGNDDKWINCTAQEKVDQVIDWKRMKLEVLVPLKNNTNASWHPLDFEPGHGWVGWKKELITIQPKKVIILEGAYSSRPELMDIIDLSVLIETEEQVRRTRLRQREGEAYISKWHQIWDSAEDYYFSQVRPRNAFDLALELLIT